MLICLAIIGILYNYGMSGYSHYLIKIRRIEAIHALLNLSLALEKYHITYNNYETATLAKLHIAEWTSGHTYQLVIKTSPSYDYILLAKPLTKTIDTVCGILILLASGEKKITGNGSIAMCWGSN